ncbi:hypothetical protein ACQPYK_20590 [Streptosporangium sp. CA-135522]|uniref:hypothetical protein n=1 Tax=Streptosporangium sp. CA-135522 TaxID=3240072 RepID=UPI003D91F423
MFTRHRRPVLVRTARMLTRLGSPAVMGAAVGVAALRAGRWSPVVVYASGLLARHGLAAVVARPRPPRPGWLEVPRGRAGRRGTPPLRCWAVW